LRCCFLQRVGRLTLLFTSSSRIHRNHSTTLIAVRPSFSTVRCKILNIFIKVCYSHPVVAAMLPRGFLDSASPSGRRPSWSYLQTGTFPRLIPFPRRHHGRFATPLKSMRSALFSLRRRVHPSLPIPELIPLRDDRHPSFFFSCAYKMQISQPLSFDIHANWWGGTPLRLPTLRGSAATAQERRYPQRPEKVEWRRSPTRLRQNIRRRSPG
jgi:hypothetical protein